jgi:hypothetical protein
MTGGKMSTHHNNFITFLFWILIGGGLYLLLNQEPTTGHKNHFTVDDPTEYERKEFSHAQAVLRLAPHTLGKSFISLN